MRRIIFIFIVVGICTPLHASELVYKAINPVFGGHPLNGAHLLNTAQSQNNYKDPKRRKKKTPAEQFSETLQRSILNRIAFATSSSLLDQDGNLIATAQPLQTNDFTISITDLGAGNMGITVIDKITGSTTEFSICQDPLGCLLN